MGQKNAELNFSGFKTIVYQIHQIWRRPVTAESLPLSVTNNECEKDLSFSSPFVDWCCIEHITKNIRANQTRDTAFRYCY